MFFSLSGSFSSASTVPAGSLANASSVGANTVNGPAPFNVSTSPAALTAATSVLKSPAETAVSTISAADVTKMKSAKTVEGGTVKIHVADGKVMINNATVTKADIICDNGVIHVIDTVLMPKPKMKM